MIAVLRYIDDICIPVDTTLIYCVRNEQDVFFKNDFAALQGRLSYLCATPGALGPVMPVSTYFAVPTVFVMEDLGSWFTVHSKQGRSSSSLGVENGLVTVMPFHVKP